MSDNSIAVLQAAEAYRKQLAELTALNNRLKALTDERAACQVARDNAARAVEKCQGELAAAAGGKTAVSVTIADALRDSALYCSGTIRNGH